MLVETVDERLDRNESVAMYEMSLAADAAQARDSLIEGARSQGFSEERQAELAAGVEAQVDARREHIEVITQCSI